MFIKKYLKWISTFLVLVGILLTNLNIYPLNIYFHGLGVVGWTIAGFVSKDKAILTNFGLQIPLFIMFRALGIESDKEILSYILYDIEAISPKNNGDGFTEKFNLGKKHLTQELNDRIVNRGIYFDTQQTQNGNTPSDDILSLQVSSGKAYVRGYEIDKVGSTSIDVLKPRTTK